MSYIKWVVAPVPTGRYRSFEKRRWPTACYKNKDGKPLAFIACEDNYYPSNVKTGNHKELSVVVTHHNHPEAGTSWKRFVLKQKFATLQQAKEAVEDFYNKHEDWLPKD